MFAWLKRWFSIRWETPKCVSDVGGIPITLEHTLVSTATALRVELTGCWPWCGHSWPPSVDVRLIGDSGAALPPPVNVTVETGKPGRHATLRIELPTAAIRQVGALLIDLREARSPEVFASFRFQVLEPEQVLHELHLTEFKATACHGDARSTGMRIHDRVDRIECSVRLEEQDPDRRRLVEQLAIPLRLHLGLGGCEGITAETKLEFRNGEAEWSSVLATEHRLRPGRCELTLAANDIQFGSHHFKVASFESREAEVRAEVERAAQVEALEFTSVNHRGNCEPLAVVAEDYASLEAIAILGVPIVDPLLPGASLALRVSVLCAGTGREVLAAAQATLILPGHARVMACLPLASEAFRDGPGTYRLRLQLGGRLLGGLTFVHRTRDDIRKERESAIWESIRLTSLELFAEREGRRLETAELWEGDTALVPVLRVAADGFDDDVPNLSWQLHVRIRSLEGGAVETRSLNLIATADSAVCDDMSFTVASARRAGLAPGHYEFAAFKGDARLASAHFKILSEDEVVAKTTSAIFDGVRVENFHLKVHAGQNIFESAAVADTTDFLAPEFKLSSSGYNKFVRNVTAMLSLIVECGGEQRCLLDEPVSLTGKPYSIRNVRVKVRGSWLACETGACRLLILLNGEERFVHEFTLVPSDEVVRRARIQNVRLNARSPKGGTLGEIHSLCYHEAASLAPSFDLVADVLAPNLVVPVEVAFQTPSELLVTAPMEVVLDSASRKLRAPPVRLRDLGSREELAGNSITIVVALGGEPRQTLTVQIRANNAVVNFEGQLTEDVSRVEPNEPACREAMSRLGL